MKFSSKNAGFTLVEIMVTAALIGVVGLVLYSILYSTMVLGAKNAAVNVSHQQARVAMIDMMQDLHSAVSLPALADPNGTPYPSPAPSNAAGISFQTWSSGPHKIVNDANVGDTQIKISVTGGQMPAAGQHLVIPAYEIEADIASLGNNSSNNLKVNLTKIYGPALTPAVTYPISSLPIAIRGTGSSAGDVVCFVTDRASYTVNNGALRWNWKGNNKVVANYITNSTPFSTPATPAGALYYRFISSIDLSTSDLQYSNRGYKSANILLNGQVPAKARLTTYQ
ncbi:MAG TPA: prepilin-type N-terminal cleavage/methylation domain-containing protein [Candidatus Udaeobacter sp.]|jgi:prepilin-type N-terminal cleavage/methylation domain-containing protein|nr:prepilin-type N-terminal cleavage/methylation domain-containing protein [Candidatus Udaeobacter sp.]